MKNKQTPKRKKAAAAIPKRKKQSEEERSNQSLLKRMIFGEEKPDLTELEAGSTTILDILSPTTVDIKSRDYIVVDGVYHTYLYITGYGPAGRGRRGHQYELPCQAAIQGEDPL